MSRSPSFLALALAGAKKLSQIKIKKRVSINKLSSLGIARPLREARPITLSDELRLSESGEGVGRDSLRSKGRVNNIPKEAV